MNSNFFLLNIKSETKTFEHAHAFINNMYATMPTNVFLSLSVVVTVNQFNIKSMKVYAANRFGTERRHIFKFFLKRIMKTQ